MVCRLPLARYWPMVCQKLFSKIKFSFGLTCALFPFYLHSNCIDSLLFSEYVVVCAAWALVLSEFVLFCQVGPLRQANKELYIFTLKVAML